MNKFRYGDAPFLVLASSDVASDDIDLIYCLVRQNGVKGVYLYLPYPFLVPTEQVRDHFILRQNGDFTNEGVMSSYEIEISILD